jgi:proline dehydrogenase
MISFENTEIAFKSKSDADLNRAFWLFKIVGNPTIVKIGKWSTNTALKLKLPINNLIKKTIFQQFCGGETIQECRKTIELLGKYEIGTILDYSVEGKTREEDFDATVAEIIATIHEAKTSTHIPFAVFKTTGISRFSVLEKANESFENLSEKDKKELDKTIERVDKICSAAHACNVPVFIDAEETWIQDTIDRIAMEMMERYNTERAIVYNTVQMYRHDRLDFLARVIAIAAEKKIKYGVKLVRGAYMEKERERALKMGYVSPIQPTKKASDVDFNNALELLITHLENVALCAGSHNEESANILVELMGKYNVKKEDERIYFAQLLGMSDPISYNLSHAGYKVAKYVPYGPVHEVMPYLLRRADENTSVAGQTSRELSLLTKEKERRSQQKRK